MCLVGCPHRATISEEVALTDVMAAARILRQIGEAIGLRLASCVDDYSNAMIPLIPDGRVLAEVFGWDQSFIDD